MSSSEWKKESFGEWAKVIPGYSFKSGDFGDVGIPIVKIAEINPPRVEIHNCKRIVPEKLTGLSKYKLRQGDIVVAMTGATIGKIGRIYEDVTAYLNQRVAKIENIQGKSDKNFIYYLLTLKENNDQIIQLGSGSAQPNFSGKDLENLQFSFPDLETQKKVAYIFTSIDDKIENNLATNQTLEEIARTLFKEWFVNFNYPNADGNLKHSEFGEIPESWSINGIGEICYIQNGYAFKSKDFQEQGEVGIIKIKNINGNVVDIQNTDFVDTSVVSSLDKKFKIESGSLLIAMTGAEVGKIGLVPLTEKNLWLNQRVGMFQEKIAFGNLFMYLLLSTDTYQTAIQNSALGSAQPNISASAIESIRAIIPPAELIEAFGKTVKPMFEKILDNLAENETLKTTRDSLLPKLMSGEIEVNG